MPKIGEAYHAPDTAELLVWQLADRLVAMKNRDRAARAAEAALAAVEDVLAEAMGRRPARLSEQIGEIVQTASDEQLLELAEAMRHIERRLGQLEAAIERGAEVAQPIQARLPKRQAAQMAQAQAQAHAASGERRDPRRPRPAGNKE